jgi:accessory gene regulator B
MQDNAVQRMGLIETLASRLAHWMNRERQGDHIDYLKMKLGIETILTNMTKGIIVYGVAIVLNLFLQTLILHIAYAALRKYSYGIHANSSTVCSIISIILFVGTPVLSQYLPFNSLLVIGCGLLFLTLLYLYAPADTDKSPIIGGERRRSLRNKSLVTCSVITIIALLYPDPFIKSLLMLGMALQIVMILPLTYKLFRRSVKNYEQFETESRSA